MQLPQSVNERFSRIASVAQGARTDGWQKLLPLAVSALARRPARLAAGTARLGAARRPQRRCARAERPRGRAPPPARTVDVASIVNAHLFGEASAPAAGSADPNAVAASQMPLVLVGTIANTDPTLGYAIIGENPAAAKVYGVGKTITGGTKLHSVYPDRAILDRGGKLEALLLPKKFQGGGMSAVGAAAGRQRGRPDARATGCASWPRPTRRPSRTSCGRSRSSRTASSAATASTRAATGQ